MSWWCECQCEPETVCVVCALFGPCCVVLCSARSASLSLWKWHSHSRTRATSAHETSSKERAQNKQQCAHTKQALAAREGYCRERVFISWLLLLFLWPFLSVCCRGGGCERARKRERDRESLSNILFVCPAREQRCTSLPQTVSGAAALVHKQRQPLGRRQAAKPPSSQREQK